MTARAVFNQADQGVIQPSPPPNPWWTERARRGRGVSVVVSADPYPRRAVLRAADMSLSDRERAEGFLPVCVGDNHSTSNKSKSLLTRAPTKTPHLTLPQQERPDEVEQQ